MSSRRETFRVRDVWNWNDEDFANFRMSYALEACDGTMSQRDICYRGADVINYYKIFYDETIGAGIPKNNGDACITPSCASRSVTGGTSTKRRSANSTRSATRGRKARDALRQIPLLPLLRFEAAGEDVVAATYTPGELA